jgi:3D (Asp-Asp-Asp) domain-containing protein
LIWIKTGCLILALLASPAHATSVAVNVTMFTQNGTLTSTGKIPRVGRTVAVSRDLKHLMGRKVYVKGIGVRHIESLTNKRLKRTVDVLVESKNVAVEYGRKKIKMKVI